jgi:hypothetical protein
MAGKMEVAYDRKTGRMVHAHHFFSLNPGYERSSSDIEALVMRDVGAIPRLAALEIAVFVVNRQDDGVPREYKVDVISGILIDGDGAEAGFKTGAGFRRP